MTQNEKKILALILKNGPMSKRIIQKKAKLSWSTVVKMVTRLVDKNLLVEQGIEIKRNVQGKDAVLYDLSTTYPLIMSVDVEYSRTQILLTNLKNKQIGYKKIITPKMETVESICHFLEDAITTFLKENNVFLNTLDGIGICIPLFIIKSPQSEFYNILEEKLKSKLNILVRTSSPSQAYTYYQGQKVFKRKNSIVLVNRGGLGGGIILDGKLYTGERRLAGEIGHIPMCGNDQQCQCGRTGCLETLINKNEIYRRYQMDIMNSKFDAQPTQEELNKAMKDIIWHWEKGNTNACDIVNDITNVLATAIVMMVTVTDIKEIYLSGYLGDSGKKIIPLIKEKVDKALFISNNINIHYDAFDEEGFLKVGPAHKIFEEYLEI